jgi:hypothetical protein
MNLDDAQRALLVDIVEAERRVPRHERLPIYIAETIGPPGVQIIHDGWLDSGRRVPKADLQTLASAGFLQSNYERGTISYFVTPAGFERYEAIKRSQGQPVERMQRRIRDYLDAESFRLRHPSAHAKWQHSEQLLWGDETETSLTTIGHLCREVMQDFATSLLRQARMTPSEPDPAKTVSRLRQFLDARKAKTGETHRAFFDALLALWGTVSDLAQRQEHGAQKEGRPLGWDDARLLVFHTMVVMYEIDAIARV